MFPQSTLLVQKTEYEWPNPLGVGRFKPEHPVALQMSAFDPKPTRRGLRKHPE